MAADRYATVIRQVREAEELLRSGMLSFDGGMAGIYFLWGQPSHAFLWEGEQLYEGEAALKRIAMSLAAPGTNRWNSKDVLQRETLRCSTEDVIQVLEQLRQARTESPTPVASTSGPWDGLDRRRPEGFTYSLKRFPVLPTGAPLWIEVPNSVVHLDVILANLTSALITYDGEQVKAVGVVVNGGLHDALWVDTAGQTVGQEAWRRILDSAEGLTSVYQIDDRVAEALPTLWRSCTLHRDLDKRWLAAPGALDGVGSGGGDRGVIVATADRVGIALYLRGQLAAAWSSDRRQPSPVADEIVEILQNDEAGAVSIIEKLEDEQAEAAAPPPRVDLHPAPADPSQLSPPPLHSSDSFSAEPAANDPGPAPASGPDSPPATDPAAHLIQIDANWDEQAPSDAATEPAPASDDPDFETIIGEVRELVSLRLGPEAAAFDTIFTTAPRSVAGLRRAITELRRTDLPGHDPEEMNQIGMEMLRHVADRLTGA